ncbi:hypothetical protein [Frateuria aurantia]|uniref:Secreted protein n=1 Tax=Frateuria aurantia (strain ATCC 33424 / DSM 6220 / KCTC 2777 / LMG 1558 / NBRC 3245 / NCIMB 13370) TaxID=767434 RepID=H8L642_FRAAD|nr:hypothetical protein [Frateuria aurantia]AFC85886.1 hypothetical protein Fraau_1463 [Frateuria aurantia DSM 6220]
MRLVALVFISALAFFATISNARSATIDEAIHPDAVQQRFLRIFFSNDLLTFVHGGKSEHAELWRKLVIPSTRDLTIATEFMQNPIGADAKYRNKYTFVNGYFGGAEKFSDDDFIIKMQMVTAYISVRDSKFLEMAKPGDRIDMACIVHGKGVEFVEMGSCVQQDEVITELAKIAMDAFLHGPINLERIIQTEMAIQFDELEPKNTLCRHGDDKSCIADMNNMSDRLQAALIAWGKANANSLKPLLKAVPK